METGKCLKVVEEGDGFFDLFFGGLGVETREGIAGKVASVFLDDEALLFNF